MSQPGLVYANWAKGKYDSYFLDKRGFYGYMHPGGCVYKYCGKCGQIDSGITFLASTNQDISGRYYICSMNKRPFRLIQPGSEIECQLVLLVGISTVSLRNGKKSFLYHYYKWKSSVISFSSITDAMIDAKDPVTFISRHFDSEISNCLLGTSFFRYLNQISGYSFLQWKVKLIISAVGISGVESPARVGHAFA